MVTMSEKWPQVANLATQVRLIDLGSQLCDIACKRFSLAQLLIPEPYRIIMQKSGTRNLHVIFFIYF